MTFATPSSTPNHSTSMMPVAEAEQIVLDLAQPLGTEGIELSSANGRVLASDLLSPQDFPPAPTSSMDGYGVRHADLTTIPCDLSVIETLPAGTVSQTSLQPGQAARLFTGSELPPGADTIVIQEDTQRTGSTVRVLESYPLGKFVRQQGQFCRAGDRLMATGQVLWAPEVALLAAVRRLNLEVYRQARVGIFSTGDELVSPEQPPQPGQIVDSNQPGLSTLVRQAGAIPHRFGIVKDTESGDSSSGKAALKRVIGSALATCDVILSSGGVSVGDYDHVESVLEELGANILIRKVAIKPGKPFTFATFPRESGPPQLYCGLPGNPVSAMVCFWRFVLPALRKLQGQCPPWSPRFATAIAQSELRTGGVRETYLWGRAAIVREGSTSGQVNFLPANEHGSGNLVNLAGTNALAVLPVGTKRVNAGEPVPILMTAPLV
ncbi:MAG: gephyrin-like molybdotransferase Glp [Cyanobacteria bacterium P01_E01_bin.34]